MSQHDQNVECPLCMEPFEMDDFTFFPCTCGYQICRFCWHRIRTDENGLCPACRKQYPEDPADFKPLSAEEIQKIKNEKRQKDQQRKHKAFESRKHLADVRVVQKNLVFVVGLPPRLADSDLLKKHHYFGKFGRIHKVVVNHSTTYAGSQGPSASAYVTYCRPEDALSAIKNVNHIQIDGRTLKASLGTTKYCSYFLKNQQCPKADCMYLHELGDEAASFTKEAMKQGKHLEYERQLQEIYQIACNKKDATSPRPQKKSHSDKDTWPSAPQNPKAAQAKESKTDKQNRSKYKYTQLDSPKRKTKGKPDDVNESNNSSNKNCKKEEDSGFPKRNPRPQNFDLKDCVNSSQSPVQRTEGLPAFRNTVSSDKQLAVSEMNNRNVQKTLLHIGGQSVYNQSMKCTEKSAGDCPSFPSSPTSSSSSSLFTPFGSLSSNFLSSSPSPPLHGGDHLSLSPKDSSHHEGSRDSSTNASPQNFVDTVTESPPCVTLSYADSDINLGNQLKTLTVSPTCDPHGGQTSEDVMPKNELEMKVAFGHSSTSKIQKPDDDLDFDPWEESSKGLGDLIAKETIHLSSATSIPPGFSFRPQVLSHVPNPRITPPPGFVHLVPDSIYDCSVGKRLIPAAVADHSFPPVPSMVEDELTQDDLRILLELKDRDFFRPRRRNYVPSAEVWRMAFFPDEDPMDRFPDSSFSAAMALREQRPYSSLCPPPGFVVPYRPPEQTFFEHAAVEENDPRSDDGHIG